MASLELMFPSPQSHFISALTVVFVNSKSLSSLKIDDTPVDDPSLKVLVANNSDTLKLLKMSSCPHVSPAGKRSIRNIQHLLLFTFLTPQPQDFMDLFGLHKTRKKN